MGERQWDVHCPALLLPPTVPGHVSYPALKARLKYHLPLKAFQDSSRIALSLPPPLVPFVNSCKNSGGSSPLYLSSRM